MATKRFFACLALAIGVICVFNIFLALRMDSVPKLVMRQMRAVPRIDILFLGNSLIESGVDSNYFTAAWPSASPAPSIFNAGMGWSSQVEHYLLAHQAYLHHPPIRCIVYGFYDLELTKSQGAGWSDLVGNRAMGYATEPAVAAALYEPDSLLLQWRFRLIGAVPMLRDHSQLWKYVELLRRTLGEIGLPKAKVNRYGRVEDFKMVALPDQPQFDQDCEASVRDSVPLLPAVQALLKLANHHNTEVIVVEMPMTSAHRDHCYATAAWQRYRAYLLQQLRAGGASYLIASDWVADDADFSDGLHLTDEGAKVFSTKMARFLADMYNRP